MNLGNAEVEDSIPLGLMEKHFTKKLFRTKKLSGMGQKESSISRRNQVSITVRLVDEKDYYGVR